MERFDVLISTLNSSRTLKNCLDSVLREIPINRIIIVDMGSTDDTMNIAKQYKEVDFYINKELRDVGESRSYSFTLVKTTWFFQIDSDIVLKPGWYLEMIKYREGADVVEGGRINHFEIPVPNQYYSDDEYKSYNNRALFGQCLIKSEAVKGVYFNCKHMEDELLRRILVSKGYKWIKNNCLLADHYSNPVRYNNDNEHRLVVTRKNYPKWVFTENGRIDKLGGYTTSAAMLRVLMQIGKDIITSVKFLLGSFKQQHLYFKGYILTREKSLTDKPTTMTDLLKYWIG